VLNLSPNKPEWLLDYKVDVFSQSGEDGIIQKILEIIPDKNKWCVEFGAWDGVYLSNTANLIKNAGYSAVLIEGSSHKFIDLKNNYADFKTVFPINTFVGFAANNGLDKILTDTAIPRDFDLLSIDVDGNDYHIFKAMTKYKPKVLVIEFNPTIPNEVSFVQVADPSVSQGSSLFSLVTLAKEKGYQLISVLPYNAFFVKEEFFSLFDINDNSPHILRKSDEFITYLFSGFDGHVFLQGRKELPWHAMKITESSVQQLPVILRKFPSNYTRIEKLLWRTRVVMQMFHQDPRLTFKRILSRILLRKNT